MYKRMRSRIYEHIHLSTFPRKNEFIWHPLIDFEKKAIVWKITASIQYLMSCVSRVWHVSSWLFWLSVYHKDNLCGCCINKWIHILLIHEYQPSTMCTIDYKEVQSHSVNLWKYIKVNNSGRSQYKYHLLTYRNSHYENKMAMRLSYLYYGYPLIKVSYS